MFNKSRLYTFLMMILLAGYGMVIEGCKCDRNPQVIDDDILHDDEIDDDVMESINDAKKIFYALPSPLETAMLIKTSGASYNEQLLNPTENVEQYTTNKSMALNMGVYITDLSFASLFDQTQTTITYMKTAKELANRLGILDAIDNETIEKLEENINNREVIMDIISETFMSSSSFLQENDRQAISAIMLIGGWIEGLYIATQLVDESSFEGNKLVERIADQKLSYDIVIKLLEQNKQNTDVASLLDNVYELKSIFDKITVTSGENQSVQEGDVTVIKSSSQQVFTKEVFDELSVKVSEIRTEFTK